jgi:exonuclease III
MRIMMWNVRGLGKAARHRQTRDYISQERIDIIGIQETIKSDFSDKELADIAGGVSFSWVWLEAKGKSGGILVGVKRDPFELEDHVIREFSIQITIRNRMTNLRWDLVTVYGPAHHELSDAFILELDDICSQGRLPWVMGGFQFNQE